MQTKIKRGFTLLEVMLSLVILSLITGLCFSKGRDLLRHHQFKSDIHKLARSIEELRTYSLCHGASIDLELYYDKETLSYRVHCDNPNDLIQNVKGTLSGITSFAVEEKKKSQVCIHFHPTFGIVSPKYLSFSSPLDAETQTYWLDLQRGSPFIAVSHKPALFTPSVSIAKE